MTAAGVGSPRRRPGSGDGRSGRSWAGARRATPPTSRECQCPTGSPRAAPQCAQVGSGRVTSDGRRSSRQGRSRPADPAARSRARRPIDRRSGRRTVAEVTVDVTVPRVFPSLPRISLVQSSRGSMTVWPERCDQRHKLWAASLDQWRNHPRSTSTSGRSPGPRRRGSVSCASSAARLCSM